MDSRAKQRLTGAVILVALFVVLVPELLTGPNDGAPPASVPADEGLRSYTIDLDAPPNSSPQSSSTPAPAVALPPVAANPTTETLPGNAGSARPEPSVPQPETPESVTPMNPAPTAATPVPTPAAPAVTPAVAAPPPTKPERGAFAVQLGSFGSKDNADRLVRDMNAKGFRAFLAPIKSGGRELYRVRVGPTPDRASAEALASDLRRIGQTGSIVPIS